MIAVENFEIYDIANWFLTKEAMSHKKLQKLSYYSVAWGFALFDKAICNHPEFEAWVHGPVSPVLYNKYQGNLWNELTPDETFVDKFDNGMSDLLESVWFTYGDQTGNSLEALTHSELPWKNARIGIENNIPSNALISVEDMKRYYRSIYAGGKF